MENIALWIAVAGLFGFALVLWLADKFHRRREAKQSPEDAEYMRKEVRW